MRLIILSLNFKKFYYNFLSTLSYFVLLYGLLRRIIKGPDEIPLELDKF